MSFILLNPLKASQVKICTFCFKRYYSNEDCILCHTFKCPYCNKCNCPEIEILDQSKKGKIESFKPIGLIEIYKSPLKSNLDVQGILSPLEGQDLVKTRNGKLILSHYTFSDSNKKIPLKIWGPLPRELYEQRYNTTKVKIKGVKLSRYNGQLQLVLQRNGNVQILSLKQKNLHSALNKLGNS